MNFTFPIHQAYLIRRYKRFFADVILQKDGHWNFLTVHVPNTGSLKSVIAKPDEAPSKKSSVKSVEKPGHKLPESENELKSFLKDAKAIAQIEKLQKCWITLHGDKEKKLPGTLEAIQATTGAWVGVNTSTPNKLIKAAAEKSVDSSQPFLQHWSKFKAYKSEFKINNETRLDGAFAHTESDLVDKKAKLHFIEIKNTTLMSLKNGIRHAQFPDAVTERGTKHLREMMDLMKHGHTCELIFVIQRDDVDVFSVAEDIDPEYASTFKHAVKSGLKVTPLLCQLTTQKIELLSKSIAVE